MGNFLRRKQFQWVLSSIGVLAALLLGVEWVLFEASVWEPGVGITAVSERLSMDPIGNSLAIIALVSMIFLVTLTLYRLNKRITMPVSGWWAIPLLSLLGLSIMLYLNTIPETIICYPGGDCQILQQTEYGEILDIPVGVWGVLGYLAILLTWSLSLVGSYRLLRLLPWTLLALTLLGVLFSLYFTFLEPFVIGATCPWCLTSAILMTILFWLSAETVQSLRLEQLLVG